jgi:hypothetical protein
LFLDREDSRQIFTIPYHIQFYTDSRKSDPREKIRSETAFHDHTPAPPAKYKNPVYRDRQPCDYSSLLHQMYHPAAPP